MNLDDPFYQLDRRFSAVDGAASGATSEAADGFRASEDGGGGADPELSHPFKFVDASTTNPVVVKTKISTLSSSLYKALYPTIAEVTGIIVSGGAALTDPIPLTPTTKIWLKVLVGTGLSITSAEITTVGPTPDETKRVFFNTATPPVQTGFWVLLAYVSAGADPTASGYDFKISTTDYHLHQVCFTHLRTEIRLESGTPYIYAYPFVG